MLKQLYNGLRQSGKIRSRNSSVLQALVSHVKRLLQLFLRIKDKSKRALLSDEVKNVFYQFQTIRYTESVSHCPMEFNSEASRFREFLESKQQKVLHLRMFKGYVWAGLIKVESS